ncbi:hypothetical protein ABIE58_002643 [Roseovarius sp. MBR-78]|jgi:hypothetical protein|uniref:hypothetical protein n=1 Tax=Roseovarius sp. MBR-78 TaxID=3156460 RepID=UPI00339510FF
MTRALAILTFVAALAFAASPFLSEGFKGFSPDQFPVPQDNPPVQPAGYAFAIWGLIYLWLIAGTGFGLFARADAAGWRAGRGPLLLSLTVGSGWIAVAQLSVIAATVLIWIMLVAALVAVLRAGSGDRWLQVEPVGAYAGWLTAAASVSVGLVLAGYGVTSETVAAYAGLALALMIAAAMVRARPDSLAYPAAVIWALIGVIVANLDPVNTGVIGLAGVGIVYLAAMMLRAAREKGKT